LKPDSDDHVLPEGINQTGVRNHNERLVLSVIQRHGAMASSQVAKRTSLSAQTASVIIRALERDGLLSRGEPTKGKVGKPSVPIHLNPDGVLAFGLKIGRRSSSLILMDFTGTIRAQRKTTYNYPTPKVIRAFINSELSSLMAGLSTAQTDRLSGIGVAAPYELWNWLDVVNAPKEEMNEWRAFSFSEVIGELTDIPVYVGNDATLACNAELVFGKRRSFADFAYFYVGSFVGGGIVLNNRVYAGKSGNAGAFGTLPVRDTAKKNHQLIHNASIYVLERKLAESGIASNTLWQEQADWFGFEPALQEWLRLTARHLATASIAACSVIDFSSVIVDGGFPETVRARLCELVNQEIRKVDTQGIVPPRVLSGSIGRQAGAIGAAYLPVSSRYLLGGSPFA